VYRSDALTNESDGFQVKYVPSPLWVGEKRGVEGVGGAEEMWRDFEPE